MELNLREKKNLASHSDSLETISLAASNRSKNDMKTSSVQPLNHVADADNTDKEKATGKTGDSSDGYDPFSQESLGPLLSSNQFGMRKIASQALMDVALMMANISQLRTLLTTGDKMEYYVVLVTMVVVSLAFQLLFALLIFVIWMRESDQHQRDDYFQTLREIMEASKGTTSANQDQIRNSVQRRKQHYQENRITSHLNYVTMVLVFIITVINMFITGFGIKLEG